MVKSIQQTISEKFTKLKNKDDLYDCVCWSIDEVEFILQRVTKEIDFNKSVQLISNEYILSNEVNEDLSNIVVEFVKIMNDYETITDAFEFFIEKHEYFQHHFRDDKINDFILELKENKDTNRYLRNNLIKSESYDLF